MRSKPTQGAAPETWDRGGLPAWTYHSEELTDLEKELLFRRSWQVACHQSDVPDPGSFITFDILGDRAIVMRDKDGSIKAFHNLCRHRGSRVLAEKRGKCEHAIVCPFHGWSYNLDGTLKRAFLPDTLPDLDSQDYALKPIEVELWMGFVFLRFAKGDQPAVSDLLGRHEAEVAPYKSEEMVPVYNSFWQQEIAVNWKAVRDVDNEGYHVPMAHPALQDLYGPNYIDEAIIKGTNRSFGPFTDKPGRLWSVRNYKNILPLREDLPEENRRAWLYIGLYPNTVLTFYPDSVLFYQEFPISKDRCFQRGATYRYANEDRALRLARYLAERIDRSTTVEDTQLIEWTWEAMASSAFDGIVLSDREYGVRSYHDQLRRHLPVLTLDKAPPEGSLAERNAQLLAEAVPAVAE